MQMQRHMQFQSGRIEKDIHHVNSSHKNAGVVVLISDRMKPWYIKTLWDAANAVPTGKWIALNGYIRKLDPS